MQIKFIEESTWCLHMFSIAFYPCALILKWPYILGKCHPANVYGGSQTVPLGGTRCQRCLAAASTDTIVHIYGEMATVAQKNATLKVPMYPL